MRVNNWDSHGLVGLVDDENIFNVGVLVLTRVKEFRPQLKPVLSALVLDEEQLAFIRYLIDCHKTNFEMTKETVSRSGDLLNSLDLLQEFMSSVHKEDA